MFGSHRVCGVFPTSSPRVARAHSSVPVTDTSCIVRLHTDKKVRVPYMCFDEAYFKTLEGMQWNRDNGCIELIPIVVGLP
jgi:hypothetical protein